MVESKFGFFQMQIKHFFTNTFHLAQSQLGISPKRFNAINVGLVISKLVTTMPNTIMFRITPIYKSVISTPTSRVDNTIQAYFTPYYTLRSTFPGIGNGLCINPAVPFEKTKDNRLATCATTTFATDTLWSKIRFISFNMSNKLDMFPIRSSQAKLKFDKNIVDRQAGIPANLAISEAEKPSENTG